MNDVDFPDLQVDDFCGTRFGDQGQLEVVGWKPTNKTPKLYIVQCKTCLACRGFSVSMVRLGIVRPWRCACFLPGFRSPEKKKPDRRKTCRICRKKFSTDHRATLTCSEECATERRRRKAIRNHEKAVKNRAYRACKNPECSVKFRVEHELQDYCSKSCRRRVNNCMQGRVILAPKAIVSGHAYIHLLRDKDTYIGVKFGLEKKLRSRLYAQNRTSVFSVTRHSVYFFPDRCDSVAAERECMQSFTCGIVSKSDMPDGWTETTYCYNIEAIEAIYRKHGGVRI